MQEHDIKDWLKKIINSCLTSTHLDYAKILVELYKVKALTENDYIEIELEWTYKYNDIHHIITPLINE
jgi:hypothetical protein